VIKCTAVNAFVNELSVSGVHESGNKYTKPMDARIAVGLLMGMRLELIHWNGIFLVAQNTV